MEKQDLEIMGGNSEVVHYERQGLPLYIRTADLEQFTGKRAACHWHDDLEWIHILDGTMNYSVNGRKLPLKVGDSLLVNGRQMHYGYGEGGCRFLCILFHPSLFGDNQVLRQEYVRPVLENPALEYLYFDGEEEEGRKTGKALRRMAEFKEAGEMAYEMDVIGWMCLLWAEILRKTDVGGGVCPAGEREDRAAQKEMVSFICRHYGEPLSLEAIAAAGHVSRSKCCQIFPEIRGAVSRGISQRLPAEGGAKSAEGHGKERHGNCHRLRFQPSELFLQTVCGSLWAYAQGIQKRGRKNVKNNGILFGNGML